MSASYVYRRSNYTLRFQFMHQKTDCCHISNCIHGTDFVKMDFVYRATVHMAFSLCDQIIHSKYVFFYFFLYIQISYDCSNTLHIMMVMMVAVFTVMMLIMVCFLMVICAYFFHAIYFHCHVRSCNATFHRRFCLKFHFRYPKAV